MIMSARGSPGRTCSYNARLRLCSVPPSSWLRNPSGLTTTPASQPVTTRFTVTSPRGVHTDLDHEPGRVVGTVVPVAAGAVDVGASGRPMLAARGADGLPVCLVPSGPEADAGVTAGVPAYLPRP